MNVAERVLGIRNRVVGCVSAEELFPDLSPEEAKRQIQDFDEAVFSHRKILGRGIKVWAGRLLPQGIRSQLRVWGTQFVMPLQTLKLRTTDEPVRLHLGSGSLVKNGYINVDLWGIPNVDVPWNLTRVPMPWKDNSVEIAFSEHVHEHLSQIEGLRLATDVHRMLQPGGVYRFAVPDPALHYAAYGSKDDSFFERFGTFQVDIDAMNQLHYGERHRHMYDAYGGARLLKAAGFNEVYICEPGKSSFLSPKQIPDTDWRSVNSIYFEAIK